MFSSSRIHHQLFTPYTPKQNGSVERKLWHISEVLQSLLLQSSLPSHFWVEALLTAVHLINRLPTKLLSHKSPYELLFHRTPDYKPLRTFNCECFPWLKPHSVNKLSPCTSPYIFLGYSLHHKAYHCFDPTSGSIHISRHVKFNESIFPYFTSQQHTPPTSPILPTQLLVPYLPSTTSFPFVTSTKQPPTPATQTTQSSPFFGIPLTIHLLPLSPSPTQLSNHHNSSSQPPLKKHHMLTRLQTRCLTKKKNVSLLSPTSDPTKPTGFRDASTSPLWRVTMSHEFNALLAQQTWILVPRQSASNILGCKWTFKIKRNSDGSIPRYKAKLVA